MITRLYLPVLGTATLSIFWYLAGNWTNHRSEKFGTCIKAWKKYIMTSSGLKFVRWFYLMKLCNSRIVGMMNRAYYSSALSLVKIIRAWYCAIWWHIEEWTVNNPKIFELELYASPQWLARDFESSLFSTVLKTATVNKMKDLIGVMWIQAEYRLYIHDPLADHLKNLYESCSV